MMPPQHDCMIYRRNLPTGCDNCGLSLNACAANKSMNAAPCCDGCSHS